MMTVSAKITQTESTHTREKTLLTITRHRNDLAASACWPPVAPAAAGPDQPQECLCRVEPP